ncbi:MAG: choice-of-anchor J domain-containing protein [Bacteroidales bacterium]
MKKISIYFPFLVVFTLLMITLTACKEDESDIPPASTQAAFDYEVTVIVIDEEEGIEYYEVNLTNRSVLAQSYFWDFGNGETSTEENPTVTYTSSGSYTITLTVEPLNDVYYNNLTESVSLSFGKIEILFEDFSEGIDYLDEDTWAPEGWQTIDNDGDGFNWFASYRTEENDTIHSLRSQSWTSATGPLAPDNWLITPEVDLTEYSEGATITFRFTVGVTASTPEYRQENYGVFISEGNDNIDNFELLLEETFTEDTPRMTPLERSVDISEYAGEVVYLAIRHFNVTDNDRIFVEEVEIFAIE